MLEKERKKPARRRAAPKPAPKPATAETPEKRTVAPAATPRPASTGMPVVTDAPVAARGAVSAAERQRMVAEAAYYRATRRGFGPGDPVRDWVEAEAEIDAQLLERR